MERVNFTKSVLTGLSPPNSGGRSYIYDSKVRGLCLSVTPKGTKSFLLYRKIRGRPIRVTLGRFPDLSVELARKLAIKHLAELAEGKNPNAVKRADRQRGLTLGQVFDDYLSARASKLSANTVANYNTIMRSHLEGWVDSPLASISRDDVERMHTRLSKFSPSSANKSMRLLRAIFNYAHGKYEDEEGHGLFPDNPVTRLTATRGWNRETPRERVIKPHELKQWFKAVSEIAGEDDDFNSTVSAYLIFLLMNGLRRREAASLRVGDVDLTGRCFTLRKTKNGKTITLPMSDYTYSILNRRCAVVRGEYVFPRSVNDLDSRPLNDPRRQIEKVCVGSGVKFSPHDLRRTFITIAESLDISQIAVKALVNHSIGQDVTSRYVVLSVERLRAPMQKISDYILENVERQDSTVVHVLHGAT